MFRTAAWAASILLAAGSLGSVDAQQVPRNEHPRPQMTRDAWLCLNGEWEFRFDAADIGIDDQWHLPKATFDRKIVVPFGWESKLSSIGETRSGRIGWYRRTVEVPEAWQGKRVWLRFEAVDWEARVWINGREVGRHEGGYTPFEFDVTDHAAPGAKAAIVVRAFDPTDRALPTGKQVFWYTPTSGIWQTVWLEARSASHISRLHWNPTLSDGGWAVEAKVDVALRSDQPHRIRFHSNDRSVPRTTSPVEPRKDADPKSRHGVATETLTIREPSLWTPERPHLYDVQVELLDAEGKVVDEVKSYFGLRTIERAMLPGRDYESILLNGRPVYLRGALDQSFNPDGVYTAPSDEFLKNDILLAKRMGLNFLRIHIKPDEPRRLYWADQLGMLIMQDMPNTWIYTPAGQRAWEATMRETIARDRNHPSIFSWCLFNETWGLENPPDSRGRRYRDNPERQAWVEAMFKIAKHELDPSRLVEDMSPDKRDHVCGDINSWHFYIDDYDKARAHIEEVVKNTYPGSPFNYVPGRKQDTAVLINSEYGSVSAGGGDRDVSWGFRYLTTQLRRHEKIVGYIYTELTDVEWEHNGFFNYDRSKKEFGYSAFLPGMTVAELQGEDFVGFDAPPALVVRPGARFEIPVFVSHYSRRTRAPSLRWTIRGVDDLGSPVESRPIVIPTAWKEAGVVVQKPIEATTPTDRPFVGALTLELLDEGSNRIAANFVNLISRPESADKAAGGDPPAISPRIESLGPNKAAIRWSPTDFAAADGAKKDRFGLGRGKFFSAGACSVEYRLEIPQAILEAEPVAMELMAEMGSKAQDERLDWPDRKNPLDYPQTDRDGFASLASLEFAGITVASIRLDDDAADARGVLSHQAAFHHGSFGQLVRQKFEAANLPEVFASLRDKRLVSLKLTVSPGALGRGLSVFGERTGRYPIDPTLVITTRRPIRQSGLERNRPVAVERFRDRHQTAIERGTEKPGHVWRFTVSKPADGWASPDFDAKDWRSAAGGFGTRITPGVRAHSPWNSGDIWLRTEIELPERFSDLQLELFHDEDVEIHVNGRLLLKRQGYVTEYVAIALSEEQQKLFRPGKNLIAVHCRQTGGGQGIDVGLTFMNE